MEEKKNNKKKYLLIVAVLLFVFILIGASFAYYSATVTKVNETNTKIQTNTLGLIYNGTKEINYQSMIPGDSFEKTFEVENTSNTAVTYNIYMQNITNQYNEDLVYTLYETDSNGANPVSVVSETVLPETNNDKWYLKTNISINAAPTIKYYKLVIEYKYLANAPQNDYQGKVFNATLGIDTVQDASNAVAWTPWQPTKYAFRRCSQYTDSKTRCVTWEDDLENIISSVPPQDKMVYLGYDEEGNTGICIDYFGDEVCFKFGDNENEKQHLQDVYSDHDSECGYSTVMNAYYCSVDYDEYGSITCLIKDDGMLNCGDDGAYVNCLIRSDGNAYCQD